MRAAWDNPEASRIDIAQALDISKVAVTNVVNKLIGLGIIENGVSSAIARGRHPVALRLRKDFFYSAGISLLDADAVNVKIINARMETVKEQSVRHEYKGWKKKCDFIADFTKQLFREAGISMDKVVGVGVSITGIINPENGNIVSSSQFPGETSINFKSRLEDKIGRPICMMNLPHLLALNEKKFGKGKDMDSFLYFDSGFGMGFVLNGKLYLGSQTHAGEMSFLRVSSSSNERGLDGRTGLLGDVAPFYKVTDQLEEIIAAGGKTLVKQYLKPGSCKVSLDMVVKAIVEGDSLCAQLITKTFEHIGETAVNLAYIFNPQAIFFEPWTVDCQNVSINVVKRHMGHYGVSHWGLKTEILSAGLGRESLSFGAALLPVDKMMKSKFLFDGNN
jgi:glucokinase